MDLNYGKKGVKSKQRELNAKGGKFGRKFLFLLFKVAMALMIGVVICGIAGGIGLFRSILAGTPTIRISEIVPSGQATMVFDARGNKIDEYISTDSNRIVVTWDQVPKELGLAFVALEDERFYQHKGVDYKGMVRAGWTYITSGGTVSQGASTITQQLLKNTIFTDWTEEGTNKIKKIQRKIQEQYLAIEVTKHTQKDDLLLRYMNVINLGQNTLGVESASQRYFGKSAIDLTISECAVIAAITKSPTALNPIKHPEKNAERREHCLNKMKELGFITDAQYMSAMADTTSVYQRISYHDTELTEGDDSTASYFSDAVYEQVKADLVASGYTADQATSMLVSGGLRIYSTLDPDIQAILDEEFQDPDNFSPQTHWYLNYALTIFDAKEEPHNFSKENMTSWFKENGSSGFNLIFADQESAYAAIDKYRAAMFEQLGLEESDDKYEESISMVPQPQVAMVVEDQSTGYVVAMEGGRGAKEGRRTLNRATNALRSPGSTFKVLSSFAPALDAGGKTLATVYNDAPFNYNGGRPVSNWYHGYYRGIQSLRDAVAQSLNIVAVKNLTVIGPRLGYDYCIQFGFTTLTDGIIIGGKSFTDVNQTLALGGLTRGVSPYELNAGYATIANDGIYIAPKVYTKVTDADGLVILDNTNPSTRRVLKSTTAYLLTNAMQDVLTVGTGSKASFPGQALAGKTGTSSDYKDCWFAGYSPYYTATVWTGYDNNIGMSTSSSNDESAISKRMWKSVMSRIHENLEYRDFVRPDGIVEMTVCSQSGLLPIEGLCDGCLKTELFAADNVPTEQCTVHYAGNVCMYDGRIATDLCPFATPGAATLPLVEDPSLWEGSGLAAGDAGTVSGYCMHDAAFFAREDAQDIIYHQWEEIWARGGGETEGGGEGEAAQETPADTLAGRAPDPDLLGAYWLRHMLRFSGR